jgi:hypothetical protein
MRRHRLYEVAHGAVPLEAATGDLTDGVARDERVGCAVRAPDESPWEAAVARTTGVRSAFA